MYRPGCLLLTQVLVLVTHPKTTTNGVEAAAMLTAMSGLAWDQVEPGSEHPQQWELGDRDGGQGWYWHYLSHKDSILCLSKGAQATICSFQSQKLEAVKRNGLSVGAESREPNTVSRHHLL